MQSLRFIITWSSCFSLTPRTAFTAVQCHYLFVAIFYSANSHYRAIPTTVPIPLSANPLSVQVPLQCSFPLDISSRYSANSHFSVTPFYNHPITVKPAIVSHRPRRLHPSSCRISSASPGFRCTCFVLSHFSSVSSSRRKKKGP